MDGRVSPSQNSNRSVRSCDRVRPFNHHPITPQTSPVMFTFRLYIINTKLKLGFFYFLITIYVGVKYVISSYKISTF